jgi:hypothetical protein
MINIPPNCAALLARGFAIFPLRHKGKEPLSEHGFKDASRETERIAAWSQKFPNCNWGVACGAPSACIVLDFDKPEALEKFELEHGNLLATYTVKTARGLHFYFRDVPGGMSTRTFDGGELRADGAYVVAEGSIHPTGVQYRCVSDFEIAEFPPSLLMHFRSKPAIEFEPNVPIAEGQRNNALFHLALSAARGGASDNAVSALLQAENMRCIPLLGECELSRIADSAFKYMSRTGGRRKRVAPVGDTDKPGRKDDQQESAARVCKAEPLDAVAMLDDNFAFIRRFVSLSKSQARVIALWIVHTHVFAAADATPYLAVTSAEKQSGKTRLLEVCEPLVANAWMTGRVSAAVLTRKIDAVQPTLLLDESDAAFSGEKEYAESLRGVLNTGHKRGGKASCCVGQGTAIGFKDFSTFCPKAIAGIGTLPDTVAGRSIPIRLKRAAPDDEIDRFRLRAVEAEAASMRERMETWGRGAIEILRDSRPALPDQLTDRQQDGAEPLLAIAGLAGGEWPEAARHALIELYTAAEAGDESIGVQLLADVREIFKDCGVDRIPSAELAAALAEIETSQWAEWGRSGKPLTAAKLARLLRPYTIVPHSIRIGEQTPKGYELKDFQDAFERYLPSLAILVPPPPGAQSATTKQANAGAASRVFSKRNTDPLLRFKKGEIANKTEPCGGVALSNLPTGEDEEEL